MGNHRSGAKAKFSVHDLDGDRVAYDRQRGESDKAWNAFLKYRVIGPERTLAKVVEALGKHTRYISQIEEWSRKKGWRLRAAEWDREVDKRSRRAQMAAVTRTSNEMAAVAESMWKMAARDMVAWHRKLEAAAIEGKTLLSPSDLQKLVDTGMKLHRLSIGEPIDNVNVTSREGILTKVIFVGDDEEDDEGSES